jgi:hypothetical protein
MRYETSKLDRQHRNLPHVMFVCDCGLTATSVVVSLAELGQS